MFTITSSKKKLLATRDDGGADDKLLCDATDVYSIQRAGRNGTVYAYVARPVTHIRCHDQVKFVLQHLFHAFEAATRTIKTSYGKSEAYLFF